MINFFWFLQIIFEFSKLRNNDALENLRLDIRKSFHLFKKANLSRWCHWPPLNRSALCQYSGWTTYTQMRHKFKKSLREKTQVFYDVGVVTLRQLKKNVRLLLLTSLSSCASTDLNVLLIQSLTSKLSSEKADTSWNVDFKVRKLFVLYSRTCFFFLFLSQRLKLN